MNVKELIEQLNKADPEALIVVYNNNNDFQGGYHQIECAENIKVEDYGTLFFYYSDLHPYKTSRKIRNAIVLGFN